MVHASLCQRRAKAQIGDPQLAHREIPARQKRAGILSGLKIALDPGHIGGEWAKMEERWFKIGDTPPVEEGEMTLRVAKMLATKLRSLGGARFVRSPEEEPVTPFRPDDFKGVAREV